MEDGVSEADTEFFFDAPVSELTLQFLGVLPYGIQTDQTTVH